MTFGNLSAAWVIAGLAGLAALLYALQQLRTRYREVTVVTTLFWRQVVDEAPVRKLRERFRHPWAYALILGICSLLWLGLAEPQFGGTDDRTFYVLVLDGSAGMAAGNRFQQAVDQIERQAARLPRDRRQVIWAGASARTILNPGEHELLLSKRLERMTPDAAPASIERVVRQLSAARSGQQTTSIVVFGDAPVRKQVIDLLPASVTVARAAAATPLDGNAGITALGISDAASGDWDKVDVFVDLQTSADRKAPTDFQIELDGKPVPSQSMARVPGGANKGFVIQDLPAAGGLLTVKLAGNDSLSLDNAASVRLPVKPLVKVALSASLDAALGPVLEADRGVMIARDAADVVIRKAGENVGGNLPALEFVGAATQPEAFLITHPAVFDSAAVIRSAVTDIGLRQIDAMSLAQSSGRPIEVTVNEGKQWKFSVWQELLTEDYDFTRSRAFPLFVANAVRWLAGSKAWYPTVAAGRPLITNVAGEPARVLTVSGRAVDPLGPDFVPAGAGELRLDGGAKPLSVSLLDADVTMGARDTALQPADLARVGLAPTSGAITWLLLLAAMLLAYEWVLFQRGRIP